MPFFPLINMPSSASRYSCTCAKHTVILFNITSETRHFQSDSMTVWIQYKLHMEQCIFGYYYLHLIFSKDTVQDQISPEHRPLTFNILKQLELCRIVVQPRWVLVWQQPGATVKPSSSNDRIVLHQLQQLNTSKIPAFRFSICRISYLFRTAISIPDEAAAAIATLKLYSGIIQWIF